ncbi:MAG: outer membrane beta-barrel protein [Deltaproteobacteria bacterium]|nr:outer membrane beta-barrel protein [Candidatus Anaeroferrophillus wilburensis]MBN2888466.1 outer membrane beta-barrel protein [Deltaproteobacteria bacterium]
MKKRWMFSLLCCVIFLWSPTASAEVQYHLTTRLTTGVEYDDNIYLDADHEKDDFNVTISPEIEWRAEAEHAGLSLVYAPGFNVYEDDSSLDYVSHSLALSTYCQPYEAVLFEFDNHFLQSEDPLDDSLRDYRDDVVRGYDERSGRDTYYRNDASFRTTYTFGDGRFVRAGYRFGLLENDNPLDEDSKEHEVSGHLGFRFDPRNLVDVDYVFDRGLFDGPDDFVSQSGMVRYTRTITPALDIYGEVGYTDFTYDRSSLDDDYQEYEGNLGFTYRFWEFYTLDVSYGRYDRNADGAGEDASGNNYHASLARVFEHKSFSLSFDQGSDVDYFDGSSNGYTEFWRLQASFSYLFADRWTFTGRGMVGNDDYQDALSANEEDSYQVSTSLSYQMLPWLSVIVEYTYDENDSTDDLDDYVDNRIALRLSGSWDIF